MSDKKIQFTPSELAELEVMYSDAHLKAATIVEFYDTLYAGDLPDDLCKELTLWFAGGVLGGKASL